MGNRDSSAVSCYMKSHHIQDSSQNGLFLHTGVTCYLWTIIISKDAPAKHYFLLLQWFKRSHHQLLDLFWSVETPAERQSTEKSGRELKTMRITAGYWYPKHFPSHTDTCRANVNTHTHTLTHATQTQSMQSLTIQEGLWVSHCRSPAASLLSSEWRQHASFSGSRWCSQLFMTLSASLLLASAPCLFVLASVPSRCPPALLPLLRLSFWLKQVCVIPRAESLPAFLCQCHQIGKGT